VIGPLFRLGAIWAAGSRPVSRQTSAENPTGAAGVGCVREPRPEDPDLAHSEPAVDLGRGYKVRPYVALTAGDTLVLADITGAGLVTNLFLTTNLFDHNQLRLRCYWDGEDHPSVDVPLGHFFASGHRPPHQVHSIPVVVAPGGGCSSYWPMPFSRHARLTLTNEGPHDADVVAYSVAYCLGDLSDPSPPRFHATFRESTTSTAQPDHVILDEATSGVYVGTSLAWTAREPGWWGEGEVKFYLDDDDEFPTLVGSGTEDYFGGAWAFGQDAVHAPSPHGLIAQPFSTAYLGCPLIETDDTKLRRISLYRWHLADPVYFDSRVRVTVQALGWGSDRRYRVRNDHIASTAYWYDRPVEQTR
jgi:Protein of unknown function (DUF2961)